MAATSSILLGGGCFWCVEAIFSGLKGVLSVQPGYAGGKTEHPSYEEVCTGKTGHAEVVRLEFDPELITLSDILRVFFTTHDPTQLNRQGEDIGTQYRSVIFGDAEQQAVARTVKEAIEKEQIWDAPLVTSIEDTAHFWRAEEKHDRYFERNPNAMYCSVVIAPKVAKARKMYRDRLK